MEATAAVESLQFVYIDGDKGILEYRGFIRSRAWCERNRSILGSGHVVGCDGNFPRENNTSDWKEKVMKRYFCSFKDDLANEKFNHDAHPMGMFISSMAAMSTFHP